jgi:hypothetical protein
MAIRRPAKPAPATKKRTAAAKPKAAARPRTFWDDLADIGRKVPKEERALLPSAAHFDDEFDHTSGR